MRITGGNVSEATLLVILRAVIAIVAAGIGGFLGVIWKKPSHKTLCGMVSFAAGALLSVTVVDIMPESVKLSGGWAPALGATFLGLIFFFLIGKYVSYVCPACAASAMEHQRGYLRLGILLMVALGIHSTVDGLGLALSSATGMGRLAILILFAVSYHKVPEGLALVSVARLAGMERWKALAVAVLIELTTGLGAFLGLALLHDMSPNSPWLGFHFGLVAGSFLYIVGFALITEMREHEKRSIIMYTILGFLAILLTSGVLAWAHIGD